MKKVFHKNLAKRWQEFSLIEQMANIGSEVSRAQKWQNKDQKIFKNTYIRALELFDLTLSDPRWKGRLKEIARVRELFCHAILGNSKEYNTTLKDLDRYFLHFGIAARINVK